MTISQGVGPKWIRVGQCIYCGYSSGKLHEEHPLPVAIGGEHSLREGCCKNCEQTINRFEQRWLRNAWGAGRASLQYKVRRKKKRPPAKARFNLPNGKTLELDGKKTVGALPFPSFGLPSDIEYGASVPERPALRIRSRLFHTKGAQIPKGDYSLRMNLSDFPRLLAKTAYGLAVWKRGSLDFEPLLNDYILEGAGDPFIYIGSYDNPKRQKQRFPVTEITHTFFVDEVQHSNAHPRYAGRRFVRVRLVLFQEFNPIDYHVIVGELEPPSGAAEAVPTGIRLRVTTTAAQSSADQIP